MSIKLHPFVVQSPYIVRRGTDEILILIRSEYIPPDIKVKKENRSK